jgi:futalosine hydrolase
MYACLIHGVTFAQVRAVSNIVERRNRQTWKMANAISRAGETALSIIEHA